MAETAKSRASHKPIADVAHPNQSAPPDTSRPVIVNNRPILHDPMMAHGDSDSSDENQTVSKVSSKVNIQPINKDITDAIDSRVEGDSEVEEQKVPSTPEAAIENHSEKDIVAENQHQSQTEQDKNSTETVAANKRDAELEKLVENETYFLPINSTTQRQTKRFIISGIGLSIFLILIWIDVALDAGIIKIGGLKALTHFFST